MQFKPSRVTVLDVLSGVSWLPRCVLPCVIDLKRVSESLVCYCFELLGSDATSPVAKSSDRRCYDRTETNSMFRLLIGTCGSDSL
ncbi:hypothetical protein V6N13_127979 [Hibiscus sabdariffa]|uniref:Secreted protein n=1 Tax=Hibiscus sabdariffa TaxID=183260 RepID=A0ABR2CF52_9ROSI